MVTDANEVMVRVCALTKELNNENDERRKAQLTLERSVFANMRMNKTNAE